MKHDQKLDYEELMTLLKDIGRETIGFNRLSVDTESRLMDVLGIEEKEEDLYK